jgi:23S rRNA pseudouridine2604 synthase
MRINKFFTDQGHCSRREADKLISAGRVQINGRKAVLGDQVEPNDEVTLDGKKILFNPKRIYIMYNKPQGVTCTTDTRVRGNIIEAVGYSQRIFTIGRLDKDSTGLIFLTNDGDIVNRILRAQYRHEKEYQVEVDHALTDEFLQKMASGVDIGDHLTLPCKTIKLGKNSFSLILTEGKNRQIRRMCEALGYFVRKLHRVRIMNVKVGDLPLGKWKEIPAHELNSLMASLEPPNEASKATETPSDAADIEE